jgi:hypothetical protein
MELDIFLPKEQLAFEYQGAHHYHDIYALGSGWSQQIRDKEKREKCKEKGITLIEIPYWWDNKLSSLISTIHRERSDLVSDHKSGEPIQLQDDLYSKGIFIFYEFKCINRCNIHNAWNRVEWKSRLEWMVFIV